MTELHIKKRYIFVTVVAFALAIGVLFLPEKKYSSQILPENLLLQIIDETRFYTTDEVASLIISGDPSIQLIDVRSEAEYNAYSLPGAINIPLDSLLNLDEEGDYIWEAYLNDESKTNILYSTGSVYAAQAWMITRRLNYEHNRVMKGGLNKWVETIMRPVKPHDYQGDEAIDLYQFRKGASMYFGGGSAAATSETETGSAKKKAPKKRKNKKAEEEGGC